MAPSPRKVPGGVLVGLLLLAALILLAYDLLSPDPALRRILLPGPPSATPAERVLDRLPERLPSRVR